MRRWRATGRSVRCAAQRTLWPDRLGREPQPLIPAGSAATNTVTINAAIGVARNRGRICHALLPVWKLPSQRDHGTAGVIICGAGKLVTTLQCQGRRQVFTLSGDGAGFRTCPGRRQCQQQGPSASCQRSTDRSRKRADQRFRDGYPSEGGRRPGWRNVDVETCTREYAGLAIPDAGDGADGDQCTDNDWSGAAFGFAPPLASSWNTEDRPVRATSSRRWSGANTGTALKVLGAQHEPGRVWFEGNTGQPLDRRRQHIHGQ